MRKSRGFRFVAAAVTGAVLALTGIGSAVAVTPPTAEVAGGPSIQSDQADYSPGSTVVLSGAGWQPGEAVHLHVNDDQGATWVRDSDVVAGDDGTVTETFTLPDWFVATYRVTATGAVSGVVTTSFTDGNVQLHVLPNDVPMTFTATPYSSDNCSGTAGASSTVTPDGNVSSAKSTSTRVHAPGTVTSSGTTYKFESWSFQAGNGSDATSTPIDDGSGDICVMGFATGKADATASYSATSTTLATSTSVTSVSPSTYGDNVTFTATVGAASTNPTAGTVTFTDATTTLCSDVALDASSQATCQTSMLTAGSHPITATYTPSGNYAASSGTLTQTVDQRTVTGSFTAEDKVYDQTTDATVTGTSLTGVIDGDDVTLTGDASFDSAAAGQDKTVTFSDGQLEGTDAGNYALGTVSDTKADITQRDVTVLFSTHDKTYDGTTTAAITGSSLSGVLDGDTVTVSGGSAQFADKHVGTDKVVSASGFVLGGSQGGNYQVAQVQNTTADITPLGITGSFTAADKTYDGTTDATVATRSLDGALTGDDVSLTGGSATFDTKDVGTGKTVTLSGAVLSGNSATDYRLTSVATTQADITAKPVTITADDKSMFLGAPLPDFTGQTDGVLDGETLDLAFTTTATSASPVGSYDIVPSVAADSADVARNYAITPVNGTLRILYVQSGFLQPVNDTAHQTGSISVFNAGQTIPLKFQLKDASGQVVQATVAPKVLAPASLGKSNLAVNETAPTTTATSGSSYVWNGGAYQYNWKTDKSMAGSYWQVGALLDDGTTQTVIIALR